MNRIYATCLPHFWKDFFQKFRCDCPARAGALVRNTRVRFARARKSRSCSAAHASAMQPTHAMLRCSFIVIATCCCDTQFRAVFPVLFSCCPRALRRARSMRDVNTVTVLSHPAIAQSVADTDDQCPRNSNATVALGPSSPSGAQNVVQEKNFSRQTNKRDIFATLQVEKRAQCESDPMRTMRTPVARCRRDNDPRTRAARNPNRVL